MINGDGRLPDLDSKGIFVARYDIGWSLALIVGCGGDHLHAIISRRVPLKQVAVVPNDSVDSFMVIDDLLVVAAALICSPGLDHL